MRLAIVVLAIVGVLHAQEKPVEKRPAKEVSATPAPPSDQARDRRVTLSDAIELGLAYNIGIKSARFDALVARMQVAREDAAWDWNLDSEFGMSETLTPSRSDLAGAEVVETDSANFVLGLTKAFRDGPTLGLRWRNDRTFTNSSFANINPAYDTNLDVSLTVPLLRGRGRTVQEAGLRASRAAADAARWELMDRTERLIQEISNAYWNLVFLQERVSVLTKALEVAEDVAKVERRKMDPEIGRATVLSVAQAEAERLRREADLIAGELDAANGSDTLRRLILPFTGGKEDAVKLDAKSRLRDRISVEELGDLVEQALAHRNDLRRNDSEIERLNEEVIRARNNLRIRLDLDAGVSWAGVSGNLVDSAGEITKDAEPSWRGVFRVEWPIGRREARAALRQRQLDLERARVERRELVNVVVSEVRLSHRTLRTSMREIAVRRKELAASLTALDGERQLLKRGSATVIDVALLEENAVDAALRLLQAQTILERSRIDVLRAAGGLLDEWGVRFDKELRIAERAGGAPKSP
ncbi:MAG: TolC family protein [Planctomycetota bacterium]|jgi:outer membrane protein TolC